MQISATLKLVNTRIPYVKSFQREWFHIGSWRLNANKSVVVHIANASNRTLPKLHVVFSKSSCLVAKQVLHLSENENILL